MGFPLGSCRRLHLLLLGLCLCCVVSVHGESIRLSDLFPFGPGEGDETVPSGNDVMVTVPLDAPILFYGEPRQSIIVHTDGVLELVGQSSSAFVYVYSADADTRILGSVFYRETTSEELLAVVSTVYSGFFPPANFTSIFIATWFYVGYYDEGVDLTNIFQCVVATNGDVTSVVLLYPEDLIEWTTGDSNGGMGGLGGDPADVGLLAPDSISSNSFFLPLSNTSDVVDIESSTNVQVDGMWIFGVDNETLRFPEPPMFSGSGAPDELSCESAGFMSCCTGDNCVLESAGMPSCSCDAQCFESGDCCSDVAEIDCHPGVSVWFESAVYSFDEGETPTNLLIRTEVGGIAQDLDFFVPPIANSFILVYSHDGTAQAPADYAEILQVIPLGLQSQNITIPVTIEEDTALESTEDFTVNITSTDEFVAIGEDTAQVFIVDNDRISIGLDQPEYEVNETTGFVQVCVQVQEENVTLERSVSVNSSTLEVSALDPEDYLGLSGMLILAIGEREVCVNITIIPDEVYELSIEVFAVCIGSDDPDVVTVFGKSLVNIIDNTNIVIGFLEPFYIGVEEVESVTLQIGVNGTLGVPINSIVEFASDTADVLDDFIPSQFVSFAEGVNPISNLTVQLIFDNEVEFSEFFTATLTLMPLLPNVILDPVITNVTILDSTVVDVQVDMVEYVANEPTGFVTVCLRISGATLTRPVSVAAMTLNGSAIASSDFTAFMGDITFIPGGPLVECVDISIAMETIIEIMEMFSFAISPNQADRAVNIVEPSAANITITDQLDVKTVVVDEVMYTFQEETKLATVCVRMSGGTLARPLSVSVFTGGGGLSAEDPSDYVGFSTGTDITFVPSGPLVECINITIIRDFLVENTETFTFEISQVQADPAVIVGGNSFAVVSIQDEADVLIAALSPTMIDVNEEDEFTTICVSISGAVSGVALARDVSVQVFTEESTAEAPEDYTFSMVDIIVLSSEQSMQQCVNITIVRDMLVEQTTEQFFFVISPIQTDPAVEVSPSDDNATIIITDQPDVLTAVVDRASYEVEETAGFVTVCVNISSGVSLARPVDVLVVTICGTAIDEIFDMVVMPPEVLLCTAMEFRGRAIELNASCSGVDLSSNVEICNSGDCFDFFVDIFESCGSNFISEGCNSDFTDPATHDFFAIMVENVAFFPNGPQMECRNISIVRDFLVEDDEMFSFAITSTQPDPAVLVGTPNISSITILDEDEILTVVVAQPSYLVEETDEFLTVCLNISGGTLARPVDVVVMTVDDCAEAPGDYAALPNISVTFQPFGPFMECVNISIIKDRVVEADEQFSFSISMDQVDPAIQVGLESSATITITDEDDIVMAVVVQSPNEVEEAAEFITSCVNISGIVGLEREVRVSVMTTEGTAEEPEDYSTLSVVDIVFEPLGSRIECVNISIERDNLVENDESFSFSISAVQSDPAVQVDDPDNLVITILDEENVLTAVISSASPLEVGESEGPISVCVQLLGGALARDIVLSVSTENGDATAPGDFGSILPTAILFEASGSGPLVECIDIAITTNTIVEFTEFFSFIISPIQDEAVQVGMPNAINITITDDDVRGVMVEELQYFAEEIEEFVTVCVVMNVGNLDRPVAVAVFTSNATATAPEDYGALPLTDLIFGPTSSPGPLLQCINISIVRDFLDEGDEVFLFNISPDQDDLAVEVDPPSSSPVIIADEPSAARIANVAQSVFTAKEELEVVMACVSISEGNLGRELRVTVETLPGTAVSPADFTTLPPSTEIIFSPGGPLEECVPITIDRDSLVENEEQFLFRIAAVQADDLVEVGMSSSASVVIVDEPHVLSVTFQQSPVQLLESLGANDQPICLEAAGNIAPGVSVSLAVSTMPGSFLVAGPDATPDADYDPMPSPSGISFSDGISVQCVSLTIEDDPVDESVEVFTLTVTALDLQIFLPAGSMAVQIIDNDNLVAGFFAPRFAVNEPGPPVAICVNLQLQPVSATVGPGGVSIRVQSTGGTATVGPGNDYDAIDETLFFPEGASPFVLSGQQCFAMDFAPNDDTIFEGPVPDTIQLTASYVVPRTDHQFSTGGNIAFIDIIDNEPPPVDCTIGFLQAQVNDFPESDVDGAEACIQMTGMTQFDISVRVRSIDNFISAVPNVDYTPVDTVIQFPPSAGPTAVMCQRVPFLDDSIPEPDEFVTLELSESACAISQAQTIVEIMNDDGIPPPPIFAIGFEAGFYSVTEGTPPQPGNSVDICVSSPAPVPVAITLTVVATTGGTADSGIDFTGIPLTIVVPQGAPRACGQLMTLPDADPEGNEFVGLTLLGAVNIDPARITSTLTIIEDDVANVFFSPTVTTFFESAGTLSFCVEVSTGVLQFPLSVVVTSSGLTGIGGTEVSQTLIFNAPGTLCVSVTIMDDDIPNEPNMFFQLMLSVPAFPSVSDTLVITIVDDPSDVANVFFSPTLTTFFESAGTLSFCVEVSPGVQFPLSVVVTSSGLTAIGGTEVSQTLIFNAPGTLCVSVTIMDDDIPNEPNMIFQLMLSVPAFPSVSDTLVITIVDDSDDGTNIVRVQFVESALTRFEDDPMFQVCFQALDPFIGSLAFTVTSRNGAAIANSDYVPINQVRSLTQGVPQCVNVILMDDSIPEGAESFFIDLDTIGTLPLVNILDTSATITIIDDDDPVPPQGVLVAFDPAFVVVVEADVNVDVCFAVTGSLSQSFSVTVAINSAASTATLGVDYTGPLTSVFNFSPFTPAANRRQCVTLTIQDDFMNGADEFILLSLSTQPPLFTDSATVVISDNDGPTNALILIDETPAVQQQINSLTAEIRVNFLVSAQAVSVMCEVTGPQNIAEFLCSSGGNTEEEVIFAGLDPGSDMPYTVTITALDSSNAPIEVIERRVRLGLNGDCAVAFVNGDTDAFGGIGQVAFIEFINIGPVVSTECRITDNIADVDGPFVACSSPFFGTFAPGQYTLKVRPVGDDCERLIRRSQDFTVV